MRVRCDNGYALLFFIFFNCLNIFIMEESCIGYDGYLRFGYYDRDVWFIIGAPREMDVISRTDGYYIDTFSPIYREATFFTYDIIKNNHTTARVSIDNARAVPASIALGMELVGVVSYQAEDSGEIEIIILSRLDFNKADLAPSLRGQMIEGKMVKFNLRVDGNRVYATNIRIAETEKQTNSFE